MTTTTTSFEIPEENLSRFIERMDALIRRAAKLGCALPTYTVSAARVIRAVEEDFDGTRFEVARVVYNVTVAGEAPSFDGWTFAAVRDHREGGAPLIRSCGPEIPVRFREPSDACDHCRVSRRRAETFVLVHEDGRWVQVGRSCIRDFLGHLSPEHLASVAEIIADVHGGEWSDGGGEPSWRPTVERYLQFVAAVIRQHGWTSRKVATARCCNDAATASMAAEWMYAASAAAKKHEKSKFPLPTAEDRVRAEQATAWAVALGSDGAELGDYLYNVRTAAQRVVLTEKTTGIIASIISTWDRAMGQARERAASVSQHIGTIGERFVRTVKPATKKRAEIVTDTRRAVTVQKVTSKDGDYGTSYKNVMLDSTGAILVWWTGAALTTGGRYILAGTVKAHGEWQGRCETTLTRCDAERVLFELDGLDAEEGEDAAAVAA
jgi:hypothetical protein